jgi:hypothetical protein
MEEQLRYAAICADLAGRQRLKFGDYENQPAITTEQFHQIKTQLLLMNPQLTISRKQARVLVHTACQNKIQTFSSNSTMTIGNILCRADIRKVCNHVEPGFDFQSEAKLQIDVHLKKFLVKFLQTCTHLLQACQKKTLTEDICEASARLILSGDLAEHGIIYANRAVRAFRNEENEVDSKGKSRSWKSQLNMSVSKVKAVMDKNCGRVTDAAGVYATATIEYLLIEVATLCADNVDSPIATKGLLDIIVFNDPELMELFD